MPTASEQQRAQQGLTALLLQDFAVAWLLLDVHDLAGTLPNVVAALTALVHRYGQASATLAAQFYRDQRTAAGLGRFTVPVADPPSISQVQASVDWATKGLWGAPDPATAESSARTLTEGAAQKMVTDVGRNTLIDAIQNDKQCRGYARVARPGACSFCLMLATRGAVYKTEQTASVNAAGRKYHDHCHCTVQPLFANVYEPPAHIRDAEALWQRVTAGKSGRAARLSFRHAVEAGL